MKILVIGSGGREHGLCWKLSKSSRVDKLYCAPGNGGTAQVAENIDISSNDIDGLLSFALEEKIDLTIVGPEEPLVLGIVDRFNENGLRIFGADKKAAQLEGSKEFSKEFMERHDIPTARYESFDKFDDAIKGIKEFSYPLVIKADGLCLGKGVFICDSEEEAIDILKDILNKKVFGSEGSTVVIEEFLDGIEASLLCFVSGNKIVPMESAKDYKKIFENDEGPNTGGVGCYSPSELFTEEFKKRLEIDVLEKIRLGLKKDRLEFTGILFIGLMIVDGMPKVLEFNVRFGDPETEVLMPRLESDLLELIEKTLDETIEEKDLVWNKRSCVTVLVTSKGYPRDYEKGYTITGIDKLDESIILFHNGTKYDEKKLVTNGGRVMSITSLGNDMEDARKNIYKNIDKINFAGMYYRKDIGII